MSLDREFDHLPDAPIDVDPLPFCHVSRLRSLPSILAKGSLQPTHCARLGRELLYFFYGSASFRTGDELTRDTNLAPIAFAFSPVALSRIDSWAPFDTGAAVTGKLTSTLLGPSGIAEYLVRSRGVRTGAKLVFALFGNNENYLRGRNTTTIDRSKFPSAGKILDLYETDLTAAAIDQRQLKFELHAHGDLSFNEHLLWVGLPASHVGEFQAALRRLTVSKPQYFTYPSDRNVDPRELAAVLQQKATEALQSYF